MVGHHVDVLHLVMRQIQADGLLHVAHIGDSQLVLAFGQGERVVAVLIGQRALMRREVVDGGVDERLSLCVTHMTAHRPPRSLLLNSLLRFQQYMAVLLHLICNRRVCEEQLQCLLQ